MTEYNNKKEPAHMSLRLNKSKTGRQYLVGLFSRPGREFLTNHIDDSFYLRIYPDPEACNKVRTSDQGWGEEYVGVGYFSDPKPRTETTVTPVARTGKDMATAAIKPLPPPTRAPARKASVEAPF